MAEGSADAGIVYSTDALTENSNGDEKKVTVLATADDSMMETPVIYPVGITSSTTKKEAAQALEEFLQSEEAMNVFVGSRIYRQSTVKTSEKNDKCQ